MNAVRKSTTLSKYHKAREEQDEENELPRREKGKDRKETKESVLYWKAYPKVTVHAGKKYK